MILAGRPGMGKTALATKIAFGAARALVREAQAKGPNTLPKGVAALFSLEMSADQLATRLLAEESRISGDRIRRGDISQRDFDRFVEVSREMATMPIVIDDTPAITISALRTRCRRLKRTRGLELVVVDYLQLMRPAAGTRPESRVLEISMITQGLKAIAKELAVPVIALSQLSRAVEQREDKRPQLSDLRESGSIEQDADMVMFVYRDDYYLAQRQPKELAFDDNGEVPGRHGEVAERHGAGAQQGGADHRQAAPRPDRRHPPVLRGRVHPLRRPRPARMGRPTPIEALLSIDLAAIAANWRLLRDRHPGGAVAAVVKADAYGLGAAPRRPRAPRRRLPPLLRRAPRRGRGAARGARRRRRRSRC